MPLAAATMLHVLLQGSLHVMQAANHVLSASAGALRSMYIQLVQLDDLALDALSFPASGGASPG